MKRLLTDKWLLKHGYTVDREGTDFLKNPDYTDPAYLVGDEKIYFNEDHRVEVTRCWTNRYGPKGYRVHIDNSRYETVGSAEVLYVKQFKKFIKFMYDEDN